MRETAELASAEGKVATAAFQQSKRHLRPFFKMLRSRELPLDSARRWGSETDPLQRRRC